MKNITITGVRGYIGGQYFNTFIKTQEYDEIYLVLHAHRQDDKNLIKNKHIHLVYYDGSIDSIKNAIINSNVIIHFAALYSTKKDIITYNALIDSNIRLFTQISTLAEINEHTKIIVPTTFSMLSIDGEYMPNTFYAATKAFDELVAGTFNVDYAFLRLPDTFGKFDSRSKILNIIAKNITKHNPMSLKKNKEFKLNLINVKDIINIINQLIYVDDFVGVNKYDLFYPVNTIRFDEIIEIMNGTDVISFSRVQHEQTVPEQQNRYNYNIKFPVRETLNDVFK